MGEGCVRGNEKKEAHVRKMHKVTQGRLRGQEKNGQGCWVYKRKVQAEDFGVQSTGTQGWS